MSPGGLKKELRFWDSVAINVGIIIGVGIFKVPSVVARHLSSFEVIMAAWVLGGFLAYVGALCYAELASRVPETGGTYAFLRHSYGRLVSFLFGWTETLILRSGSIAAVAYIFSAYLANFLPLGFWGEKTAAIVMIVLLTQLNILGLRLGKNVQNALSILKVAMLIIMSVLIFLAAKNSAASLPMLFSFSRLTDGTQWSLLAFSTALVSIMWTYGGWHEAAFMSGEFHDTRRELPLSLVTSTIIVTGLYLLANLAYFRGIPISEMSQSKALASDIFKMLFGASGGAFITIAVLISAAGALNSTIMTGGRIPFAVAGDFPRLKYLAFIDPKFHSPKRALELNQIIAVILVLAGSFEKLLFFSAFAQWLFFGFAGFSLFVKRKTHRNYDGFCAGQTLLMPALFTLTAFLMCSSIIVSNLIPSVIGLILILLGVPVYYYLERK